MTTKSLLSLLLLSAAAAIACGGEDRFGTPFQPEPPPQLTTLDLRPSVIELFALPPGNTVQLSVSAWDEKGAPLNGTHAATYASSDPEIADVGSTGLLIAGAPGTAEITATFTLRGVTKTASMAVTVKPRDYPDVAGSYDLTASITSYDPAWGEDLDGYRYTAVLTLPEEWPSPQYEGTYADLKLISPGGDIYPVTEGGSVINSIGPGGEFLIELVSDGNSIGVTLIVESQVPGSFGGIFGCCGHISGIFTAERR
jgi:Bacterial Ig-like domain (group 2)